jgi:hypothetical protein
MSDDFELVWNGVNDGHDSQRIRSPRGSSGPVRSPLCCRVTHCGSLAILSEPFIGEGYRNREVWCLTCGHVGSVSENTGGAMSHYSQCG